jgi:predicted 2-oxoglutarate/Fe(II)-dependent dioxygenase YbiX
MNQIKDYILIVENVITDNLCAAILEEYERSEDWVQAEIIKGDARTVRNCQTIGMSFSDIIGKNQKIRKELDSYLFLSAGTALRAYTDKYEKCALQTDTGYELLKYEEGGFYSTHTDHHEQRPRTVSCSFVLNDDYEGGEFAFFNREIKYKLKKGSAILFPANFMYPNEIMPVTSGTRYSIVTWFV